MHVSVYTFIKNPIATVHLQKLLIFSVFLVRFYTGIQNKIQFVWSIIGCPSM